MSLVCPGYKLLRRLGEGGFGIVQLAERCSDKKVFAVKSVRLQDGDIDFKAFEDELFALRELSHPNIVTFVDVVRHQDFRCLVMEFCEAGDLRRVINMHLESNSTVPEGRVADVFIQLLLALHHCHHSYLGEWTLLHRDIKPENVLLTASGTIKLADFGLSKILDRSQERAVSLVGTPGYLAPEVLSGKPYDSKADMFGLGCLLFELCTLSPPRYQERGLRRATALLVPMRYSLDMRLMIQSLLQKKPGGRPTAADLLSRRMAGEWLLQVRAQLAEQFDSKIGTAFESLEERERALDARETAVRAKERVLAAKQSTLEAQLRRLTVRASMSPPLAP